MSTNPKFSQQLDLGETARLSSFAVSRRPSCGPFAIFAFLVFGFSILITFENALSLGFLFERNYNEGWNVYNAARFLDHNLIYDDNYWRVNNYPIISFVIIGGVNFFIHDLLLSGRIVALASLAAVGGLAALTTRRLGGERIEAVFGAGCALGFCCLMAPAWVAADDPQTLGEAVMLGGLVSYLSRPPDRVGLFRTAFLIVLGCFTKHNLLGIPIAITLDLALRSPRRLWAWLASCAALAAGFLGLTRIVAGGAFIDHLLSPRIFSWHGVHYHLMKYLRLFKFPLVTIVLGSRLVFPGARFVLAAWGIASILLATILSGFEGTSYNMFQDAAVFLGVAAGVMLFELRKAVAAASGARGRFTGGTYFAGVLGSAIILLAQPIWAHTPSVLVRLSHSGALLAADREAEQVFLTDARYISEARGLAICESLLLCYVAGEPFILDPFNSRQYILAGKLDQRELIRRIAAQEFAVIQLRADICDDPAAAKCRILHYPQKFDRFTDETLYAIDRYYAIGRRSQNGTFYVPR